MRWKNVICYVSVIQWREIRILWCGNCSSSTISLKVNKKKITTRNGGAESYELSRI
jgi:hypothetical protein